MNTNKYLNKLKLARGIAQLGMCNLVKEITGQKRQETLFRGETHIVGIKATKYIDFHMARLLPLWPVIGYHRSCVVYIPYK